MTAFRVIFLLLVSATPVFAHVGGHFEENVVGSDFLTGFLHPIFGWDHVAAMVAVGLWGAFLGPPAIWILPVAFPIVMALGGAAGIIGIPLPLVEPGIAASALVLGVAIALAWRPPIWVAAVIVGFFAIFHGHAHGEEMPTAVEPFAYAAGFVIATGLLHVIGIGFGALTSSSIGKNAVRAMGVFIAVAGLGFLYAAV